MKIQKFAQSTFTIENKAGKRILIDPGKYNFEKGLKVDDFNKVDVLIITHKHADHFDLNAAKLIVNLYNPIVLTNPEISVILQNETIGCTIGRIGDRFEFVGFMVTYIKTDHVVGDEAIVNFGIVIESDGKRIYHTSDTRLIELQLLPHDKVMEPDVLCVPISDRGVVMGIDEALYFTNEIRPKIVIPMHYDSPKDKDRIRPEHFIDRLNVLKNSLRHLSKVKVKILTFGEETILE